MKPSILPVPLISVEKLPGQDHSLRMTSEMHVPPRIFRDGSRVVEVFSLSLKSESISSFTCIAVLSIFVSVLEEGFSRKR